jgi:uncharacterized protein (DUF1697 family)
MPIYVAMLRGINVGRGKVVKMERLRALLGSLGSRGVRTYVQSGNVVFESEQKSTADLSKKIETKILREFGFAVPVILKTARELKQIVSDNPLVKEKGIDHSKLHVTFLSDSPATAAIKALEPLGHKSRAVPRFESRSLSLLPGRLWEKQTRQYCYREKAFSRRYDQELENGERASSNGHDRLKRVESVVCPLSLSLTA